MPYNPRTVEHVFKDYKARRAAMLRALTDDVEEFSRQCDPDKENLCLYGYPNEEWEVNFPAEEVPPELPEPALGINFARDGMQRKDWLSLVAVHSDVWLYAVAFFYGARFDKYERKRLFGMINELPTLFDLVSGRKTVKEKGSVTNSESKVKTPGNLQKSSELQAKSFKPAAIPPKDEEPLDTENDDEEHGDTTCGSCGRSYNANEFWICCDACEKWFHGKCVKITAAKAEHIKQYICPRCSSNKRART